MGWFRSNGGSVAWLAFFALACHLFLSFGHIHLGKLNGGSAAWVAADDAGGISTDVPPTSPQNTPNGLGGGFLAVFAKFQFPQPPVLPDLSVLFEPPFFSVSKPGAFARK